jgi:NAD+ kinase
MSEQFKTVAVVGRSQDLRVAEPMALLAGYLNQAGVDVVTTPDTPAELPARQVAEADIGQTADLVIAVGGDGTMLHAASLAHRDDVPLLGVNRGRLGFLADITPDEMLESVGQILAGNYTSESRLMLRTSISGRFVNTHSGDGLIIATPTGSTAYALSCGGPIIEPAMNSIAIVPICPHTLSDRPIVVPASEDVEVRLLARFETQAEVMVDGHALGELNPEDRLVIRKSDRRITLIHPPGYDFYGILRSKLHWGRDSRLRDIQADEE